MEQAVAKEECRRYGALMLTIVALETSKQQK